MINESEIAPAMTARMMPGTDTMRVSRSSAANRAQKPARGPLGPPGGGPGGAWGADSYDWDICMSPLVDPASLFGPVLQPSSGLRRGEVLEEGLVGEPGAYARDQRAQ